jgi:hypothetical protein
MDTSEVIVQMVNDLLYVGPQDFTQTYAPTMLLLCEIALMKASATARLAGGTLNWYNVHDYLLIMSARHS